MIAVLIKTKGGTKDYHQKVAHFPPGEEGRREMNNKDLCTGQRDVKDNVTRHSFVGFPSNVSCTSSLALLVPGRDGGVVEGK